MDANGLFSVISTGPVLRCKCFSCEEELVQESLMSVTLFYSVYPNSCSEVCFAHVVNLYKSWTTLSVVGKNRPDSDNLAGKQCYSNHATHTLTHITYCIYTGTYTRSGSTWLQSAADNACLSIGGGKPWLVCVVLGMTLKALFKKPFVLGRHRHIHTYTPWHIFGCHHYRFPAYLCSGWHTNTKAHRHVKATCGSSVVQCLGDEEGEIQE